MNSNEKKSINLNLLDLQTQFSQSLLYKESDIASQLKDKNGFTADSLMQIHRNNFVISVTDSLRSTFNYTEQLVGEEFFDSVARQYLLQQPPVENNICTYGEQFPAYLSTLQQLADMPYIAEMAKFEWAYEQCQHLPQENQVLDITLLQQVSLDSVGKLQFTIASNSLIFDSQQDIYQLYNMLSSGEIEETNLNQPCYLLLQKQSDFSVQITPLSKHQWQLLQQLQQHVTLDALQPSYLQEHLSDLLTLNLISGFTINQESTTL